MRYILLLILLAACQSAEQREAQRIAAYERITKENPEEPRKQETKEERRENARYLLQQAGEAGGCEKARLYEDIINNYADLPEAKFARKNLSAIGAKAKQLNGSLRKSFLTRQKLDPAEANVSERIQLGEELLSGCSSETLMKLMNDDLTYYKTYRLKNYGY